ncbi:hypothetical protein B9T33_16290 [Acinetobacter sp. ANC 5054]|uniref:antitoxin Xre/MbcA/ParS toxin-binding domain-containing protein n=1 Tax=Acinetobacter sp. ANC 5054 TaxID=1977877 RepID=UPI000A333C7B|nr:antitoxin Xre/MbcA/ParS toxin-binding domain-containing protein [Acinetobacter sp. ANC 5054]OTG75646.1 hypothetical protein B9T33_16290 [Acinetobacter sp. ANC 5054]
MDNKVVLSKAVLRTAEKLGLSMDQLAQVLGADHTAIINMGVEPVSTAGQQALLLIRVFQSLYALNGGDVEAVQTFMRSPNRMTEGIPVEQIQEDHGLVRVLECIQALLIK